MKQSVSNARILVYCPGNRFGSVLGSFLGLFVILPLPRYSGGPITMPETLVSLPDCDATQKACFSIEAPGMAEANSRWVVDRLEGGLPKQAILTHCFANLAPAAYRPLCKRWISERLLRYCHLFAISPDTVSFPF
jgi:hypothetical protein